MNGLNLSNIQDAKLGSTQVSALYYGSTKIWESTPDYSSMYFTIESQAANNKISWKASTSGYEANISYSTDLTNWTSRRATTSGTTLATLENGDKLYLKGSITGLDDGKYNYFSSSYSFKVYGNIMSLTNGDSFASATSMSSTYQLQKLFYNCKVTDASNLILPATTLTSNCYRSMFIYCSYLLHGPTILPATTLQSYCYREMFSNCNILKTSPILPATTLTQNCYQYMFNNCTSLNHITCLATNISATGCTSNWVINVASSGTFYKDASMTSWPTGSSGIPSGWTVVNV